MLPGILDIIIYRLQSIALSLGSFFFFLHLKSLLAFTPNTAVGAPSSFANSVSRVIKGETSPESQALFRANREDGEIHRGCGRPPVE